MTFYAVSLHSLLRRLQPRVYDPQLIIVSKSKEAGFSDAQLKLGSFLKVPRRC